MRGERARESASSLLRAEINDTLTRRTRALYEAGVWEAITASFDARWRELKQAADAAIEVCESDPTNPYGLEGQTEFWASRMDLHVYAASRLGLLHVLPEYAPS